MRATAQTILNIYNNQAHAKNCRSGCLFSDPARTLSLGPAQVSDCADSPGPETPRHPCGSEDARLQANYSLENLIHIQDTV
jgi:hypothetical protein